MSQEAFLKGWPGPVCVRGSVVHNDFIPLDRKIDLFISYMCAIAEAGMNGGFSSRAEAAVYNLSWQCCTFATHTLMSFP